MNLVIIGAGPAGEAAAKSAAYLRSPDNLSITLIEQEEAGGLCLNKGCIPSKMLLEQVHQRSQAGQSVDWRMLQQLKQSLVTTIRKQLETNLKSLKINLVRGAAVFRDKNSLDVKTSEGTKIFPFDKAIIAAGTEVYYPSALQAVKDKLFNSDKILEITKTPTSIAVIGGGAVGCEFACLLQAAGSKVTMIEMKEGLVPGEDPTVVSVLTKSFEDRGIVVKTSATVQKAISTPTGWKLTLSTGEELIVEEVLACVGRTPKPESLGLEKAGIQSDRNGVTVDTHLRTTNPHVYAAGDVTGQTRLAHAASVQGQVAAANALGDSQIFDGSLVPRCLYSWPEVASVGAWKHLYEEQNKPVKAVRAFFKGSGKAMASGETDGFVQIVFEPESERLLGAQIIGPHATELIHIFSVALKAKMTRKDLSAVIFAHPTLAEVIREAVRK